jgi:hypothetical protein
MGLFIILLILAFLSDEIDNLKKEQAVSKGESE